MNLLFFASDNNIGLSSLLVDQLVSINKTGRISVIAVSGEKEQEKGLIDKVISSKINLIRIKDLDIHKSFLKNMLILKSLVLKNDINVVHVQNNWQLVMIGLVNILLNRRLRVIYTIHGYRNNQPLKSVFAVYLIGFLLFLFANKIIYMSDFVKNRFNFLSKKMSKIYLGIDDRFFESNNHSINIDNLNLVFPAQFRIGKNQEVIIKSFASYVEKTKDNKSFLYLPGEGPLKDYCEKLCVQLNVKDQVVFPGLLTKNEIKTLYQKCNIGIISSNSETYGQSIVEPYVLGRCVISKRVGVAPEIIVDGVNGFLFENETDLFEIISKISKSKEVIKVCGIKNFENRNIFTWQNHAEKLINQYLNM